MSDKIHCSICGQSIEAEGTWTLGHNAQPVTDGRCCSDCNALIVIPCRINPSVLPTIQAMRATPSIMAAKKAREDGD